MKLFRNPTAEYRGTPFWSWNTKLNFPQLRRQIDQFKKMGFGGVHIHARTGLATEYLGDEFMSLVKKSHEHLKKRKMLTWLYDEDRWPSGFAGGIVTREPTFREKTLLFTKKRDDAIGTLLAQYAVSLENGRLTSFRRISTRDAASREIWIAYLRTATPDSWFNHQTYADTFNRAAIARFIEVTHEKYRKLLGKDFGKTVPSIFCDEPHFTKKQNLARAEEPRDVVLPFSDDFVETFQQTFGRDLLDDLPELFWDRADGAPSLTRFQYHEHTAERFAKSFGDQIAAWCGKNNLALTGHMLSEATLFGQTRAVGEVMRGLRSFQLPGIDMLEDKIELTTAKQAQSVARQNGREGVLSEMYGVTNWTFDFAGHKRQGDWQAALGVTVRVPHLAWVSMAGEAKRDYPAAIGYQSPWFEEYKLVEDHFARVATVMTRGRPIVRVAVIHPIESFWLKWGPVDHNGEEWKRREAQFRNLTEWLVFGGIDFDFVGEASLSPSPGSSSNDKSRGKFKVGQMEYDTVVVPDLLTIRATTLEALRRFHDDGGKVIVLGDAPPLVDAQTSNAAQHFGAPIEFTSEALLAALEPFREIDLTSKDGNRTTTIAHQLRSDGKHRNLFLCNTDRARPVDDVQIRLYGRWRVDELNTLNGKQREVGATLDGDQTIIPWSFDAHGHALFRLSPGTPKSISREKDSNLQINEIRGPVPISLSEPNVLLLDQAEWKLNDDRKWQPIEEILRLDNLARTTLNLPTRGGRNAQPWTDTAPDPVVGTLHLRFTIRCDVAVKKPTLAIEQTHPISVSLNGKRVTAQPNGWWVDESIQTILLPSLSKGQHRLEFSIPMRRRTNVEWCYLLGDFGVAVRGRSARIIAPPRKLKFGDWTHQGLPFYAGNVTYHCDTVGQNRDTTLSVRFENPLVVVHMNGKRLGPIAFAPYELSLGKIKGKRRIDITAYGNRHNAFGPLHHTKRDLTWVGPAAWRSSGEWWSYDYHFKPIGVMGAGCRS